MSWKGLGKVIYKRHSLNLAIFPKLKMYLCTVLYLKNYISLTLTSTQVHAGNQRTHNGRLAATLPEVAEEFWVEDSEGEADAIDNNVTEE